MKILIGITYYYPNISGVTIYAKRLAEGLVKKGHQVVVVTSRYDNKLPACELINGVEVRRSFVYLKIGKGVIMPFLPLELFSRARNFDLVNCHLPQFESFIFTVISRIFGKKVVLTHHTDLSGWKGLLNQLSETGVWFGQLISGALADKIVPYTKDYADHSRYLQKFKKKLMYILPPISVGRPSKKIQAEMKGKIGSAKHVIGFAGRIARQKGIPYLLNCIPCLEKSLENFKIVFAGPYQGVVGEKYFEEIDALIKKYKEFLVFLGNVPEKDMSSFYCLCDVLVLPSNDRLESFGLVQPEAMLNGCPVVATDLPGARMPVKMTGMGLVVPPANAESLGEAILEVLCHKNKYVISKEKIKLIFNDKKTVREYEKLFNSLITDRQNS